MPDFVSEFKKNIFNITQSTFEFEALRLFHYQKSECKVYQEFLSNLSLNLDEVNTLEKIPFLPVEFFKTHKVSTSKKEPKVLFESSGTTGTNTSRHYIQDLEFYKKVSLKGFEEQFGKINEYCILALLPSYLERKNSSLVYMVQHFIEVGGHRDSGFYLHDFDKLVSKLMELKKKNTKVLLIGVSFALLDLAEKMDFPLNENFIVMETGGMKGKRKEMTRDELHHTLKTWFGVSQIYSEYGMTELMSQAYLKKDNNFQPPPWMRILVSDLEDPLTIRQMGRGVINMIDLANVDSCAFIKLQDACMLNDDGTFEVLGRVDNSDMRGCNLLYL